MGSTQPPVPFLPGNLVHFPLEGARAKTQKCRYVNGRPIVCDEVPAGGWKVQAPYADHGVTTTVPSSTLTDSIGSDAAGAAPASLPNWLAFEGKVLRWFGYWTEAVPGSLTEAWRVRRCALHFYLEDGSFEVVEPRADNSGLDQGRVLRRHRAKLAGGALLDWADVRVGGSVDLYGRAFHITGCDGSSRRWLEEQGAPQAPEQGVPEGPADLAARAKAARDQARERPAPLVPRARVAVTTPSGHNATQQFLDNDGKVLRFYAAWVPGNPAAPSPGAVPRASAAAVDWDWKARLAAAKAAAAAGGGAAAAPAAAAAAAAAGPREGPMQLQAEPLPYVVHYYLGDDTIEVAEMDMSGRDPFPLLLRRCRLPRTLPVVGARPADDAAGDSGGGCYTWQELGVGQLLKVYGRDMLLIDADAFTRFWVREQTGRELALRIEVDFHPKPTRPADNPDASPSELGIGCEEDTRFNFSRTIPKQPPRDMVKLAKHDGHVLRFGAAMTEPPGASLPNFFDGQRKFVISYYMADDTLSVFEPPQRNSGIPGGRVADRSKVLRPGAGPLGYYRPADMRVGASVVVNGRGYRLTEADEHTHHLMEQWLGECPQADAERALRSIVLGLSGQPGGMEGLWGDLHSLGAVTSAEQLHEACRQRGLSLDQHEALAVVRALSQATEGTARASASTSALLAALC